MASRESAWRTVEISANNDQLWNLICSTRAGRRVNLLVKRGDKSDWIIAIVGPLLSTAIGIAFSLLLYYLGSRRRDSRDDAISLVAGPTPAGADVALAEDVAEINDTGQMICEQPSSRALSHMNNAALTCDSVRNDSTVGGAAVEPGRLMPLNHQSQGLQMDTSRSPQIQSPNA